MRHIKFLALATLCFVCSCGGSPSSSAVVSFTVDDNDGPNWQALFASKGIVGTSYLITGFLTESGWSSELALQSAGWELGGHTRTHPHLPTLTSEQLDSEIGGCLQDMKDHGIANPQSFAYPYGDRNAAVVTVTSKYWRSARVVKDNLNMPPYTMLELNGWNGDTEPLIKDAVRRAIERGGWLIIMLHTHRMDYPKDVAKGETIARVIDYIHSKKVPILTVSQAEEFLANRARSAAIATNGGLPGSEDVSFQPAP